MKRWHLIRMYVIFPSSFPSFAPSFSMLFPPPPLSVFFSLPPPPPPPSSLPSSLPQENGPKAANAKLEQVMCVHASNGDPLC